MTSKTPSGSYKDSTRKNISTPTRHQGPRTPFTPRNRIHGDFQCKTPGDRFIPNRSASDLQFSRFKLTPSKRCSNSESVENSPPSSTLNSNTPSSILENRSKSAMTERLLALKGHSAENRILSFNQTPSSKKSIPGRYEYWTSYTDTTLSKSHVKKVRKTPKSADKVLDAPNLINDFYLNVLDWSKQDMLSIALGAAVYIFDASKGDIHQLCDFETESTHVTALKWNKSGKYLAIGTSDADIQLWDVNTSKCVRRMKSHESRVSSLSWNPKLSLLSSGSQDGSIHNYDPRLAQFQVQTLKAHKLDVCGLQWSTNHRFLASGGNDNVVNVWDTYGCDPWTSPSHSFHSHTAAIKALSWCPWKPSILASGGGTSDKSIRLWNACSGESCGAIKTNSQVSGLVWSSSHRELLSCHGAPCNSLRLWKWQPDDSDVILSQLAELNGHEGRILHVTSSPDGQSVATAGADETLRFWKCFNNNKELRQKSSPSPISDINISRYMR